jgi:hypothetical protein
MVYFQCKPLANLSRAIGVLASAPTKRKKIIVDRRGLFCNLFTHRATDMGTEKPMKIKT